jgi:PPIC-type PPIASE domain
MRGLALFVVATVLLAGCGSSSSTNSTTTPSTAAGASGTAASTQSQSGSSAGTTAGDATEAHISKPAHLASGIVAKVDGTSITTAAYNHSLQLVAQPTVKPLIANPSDYSACTSALKAREAQTEKLIKSEEEEAAKRSKGRAKEAGRLREHRKPRTAAQLKEQCELQYKSVKQQALNSLIRRVQSELEAKELGVSVNESEVAKLVKTREASQKAIAKNSRGKALGLAQIPAYSAADLKEMVTSEVLETQIQSKLREKFAKPISQSGLEKYFNEHKQLYAQTEKRSIVFASSKSQSAAEAIAKEHGSLSAAATKHSSTATPTSVGCEHTGAKLSPIYSAICSAKTGVVSGPVKMPPNYYVFEVKSITPATKPNFGQAKARIKQLLESQGDQEEVFKYSEALRTKLKSHTECAAGYIVTLCKEYVLPKVRTARPLTKP